jgi:hypothetical protein
MTNEKLINYLDDLLDYCYASAEKDSGRTASDAFIDVAEEVEKLRIMVLTTEITSVERQIKCTESG